jgi:hypothetical protein
VDTWSSDIVFPSTDDFLQAFGLEPIESDRDSAYCRYVKPSSDGNTEIDFSFNAAARSFQAVLRCGGNEIAAICSEKVKFIEIRHDKTMSGLHVVFDIDGVLSEALIALEPTLHCKWWLLSD